jgi:hypothetical protein
MKVNRNIYEKIKEKLSYVFTFVFGFITLLTIIYILNEFGVIHLIDPAWQYYAKDPKPDGEVYLHIENSTTKWYIGHQPVIDLCRGQKYGEPTNTTFMGLKVSCGAINCECWVIE